MYHYTQYVSSTDRIGQIGTREYTIEELSRKLKYPVEEVLRAVQEVGFDPEEVREYIRDRHNRS